MIEEDNLHIIEKRSSPRIEPCVTPYFNVTASEKNRQCKPKGFCLKDRSQII